MSGQDSDESGSYTEAVGTRLTTGTKDRFEAYRDEIGAGNSEALRRLVRAGLDAQDEPAVPRYLAAAVLAVVIGMGLLLTLIALPYRITSNYGFTNLLFLLAFLLNLAGTVTLAAWFVRTYLLE